VNPELGTGPLEVGGEKVQLTVTTTEFCWASWMVADVNATSVMVSVHLVFGQPGAPGIGLTGAPVVVVSVTLPFLMSLAGTAVTPVSVTDAGFCPGGWVAPAGFVQIAVGFPVAVSVCVVSKFPSPAYVTVAVSVDPLSVNDGPDLTCGLAAVAAVDPTTRVARATAATTAALEDVLMRFLLLPGSARSPAPLPPHLLIARVRREAA
jgi:hypothetical protein